MGYVDTDEQVKIPVEIYEWELAIVEKQLKEMPKIHKAIRIRDGKSYEIIRWVDTDGVYKEMRLSRTPHYLRQLLDRRMKLERRREVLSAQVTNSLSKSKISYDYIDKKGIMDGKFFDKSRDRCQEPPKDKCYKCNGYYMRSRAEMHIGEVLNTLGLPFKYEVNITDLGDAVDFLVYIPSLDCCFILEFFGRGHDYKYMNKTSSKLIWAFNSRYRLYYEYVFLAGDENSAPSKQDICSLISIVIANLCQERMVYK